METGKALQSYDYIIIAGYFLIILGTAAYFSKRTKLSRDFFIAGGSMPWWLAGISFFMASHSALSFVMYGQLGYKYGITAVLIFQVSVTGLVIAGLYVARRWRRSRTITPIQFLERRYSLYMRQALAWTGFPVRIVDDAMKIFSTAIFVYVGMKLAVISLPVAITLVGLVMIVYALTGGQKGVIVTDFLQFIITMIIVIIIFVLTILRFYKSGFSLGDLPYGFLSPFSGPYHAFDYFSFVVLMIISYNTTWSLVHKFNCVPAEKDASKVAWLVAILNFIAPIIFFSPSILARLVLPRLAHPEYSYAAIAFTVLPTGLMGILVVGMFASTIATMGSEFNVLAGILTNDLYKRIFRPDATDQQLVKAGKIATVLAGGLIILMATIVASLKGFNLFDIMLKAFGALLPATALPILMGFFWKRISARGALYGLIAGALTGTALVLINVGLVDANSARFATHPGLQYWLKQGWDSGAILLNSGMTILVMYLASIRYPSALSERERSDSYFRDLETQILAGLNETTAKARLSNAQVVAVATLLFGILVTVIGVVLAFQPGHTDAPIMNLATGLFLSLVGVAIYLKEHRDKQRR